ncbi:hypothetical protein [Luteibacter sp.]|uniref:hypothetical protein n=1 Tax=Luteibacter sp. TaxID=1886636 RepID=UPI002F4064C9
MAAKRTYWFGPKRVGWGIGPRSWQGWATIVIYCGLMISLIRMFDRVAHPMLDAAIKIILTAAFLALLFWKADRSKQE